MNEIEFGNEVDDCIMDLECIASTLEMMEVSLEKGLTDNNEILNVSMLCTKSLLATIEKMRKLQNVKIEEQQSDDKV